ncbi:hypothetical protein LPB140_10130 [Sphingorhabdus lutea]|uniref:HNH domain-containing protein n=1 Tax=Sphingorhabdus lutea TaxID=1913578 RepID=A0A1L3JD81_9SPHN|nr:HNH endonuclease signature motif containing protein [Sphingorhabdus lutea]APG63082.1 hypothetical protein LPB140_10130 [Sphingorhabdus lutea]
MKHDPIAVANSAPVASQYALQNKAQTPLQTPAQTPVQTAALVGPQSSPQQSANAVKQSASQAAVKAAVKPAPRTAKSASAPSLAKKPAPSARTANPPKTLSDAKLLILHSPLYTELPYRMLCFNEVKNGSPVYYVAGVEGGPWNSQNALKKAHEKHGGNCFYCKKPVGINEYSIDHVEAKQAGNIGHLHNLVIAHRLCNQRKGADLIEYFNADAGEKWLKEIQNRVNIRLANIQKGKAAK